MDREGNVRVVFEGRLSVSYGQAYVAPADDDPAVRFEHAFAGQVNGLLGAGDAGGLYLTTGLHTGDVGFRLVVADGPTPLGEEWEDVVETSFVPYGACAVRQWGEDDLCEFDLPPVPHRARYCARNMDEAHQSDVVMSDEPLVDHYELAFWPADPAPEQIVRQGSKNAEYWHRVRNFENVRRQQIASWWGEDPPSDRLIDVPEARRLVRRRRDLAEALAAASPGEQRAVAIWAARYCCEATGADRRAEIALALRLQGRGEILPPGFDYHDFAEAACEATQNARNVDEEGRARPEDWAIRALCESDHEHPLIAALNAVTDGAPAFAPDDAFLDAAAAALAAATAGPDPRHDPWQGDDHLRTLWDDEMPDRRLLEAGAHQLAGFDPGLAERLAEAAPETQREVARWAARRACTAAGLTAARPEVARALDRLDRGEPLPAPFDGASADGGEWALLDDGQQYTIGWFSFVEIGEEPVAVFGDHGLPDRDVPADEALTATVTVDGRANCSRAHYTLGVIREAAEADPLRAATHALWTAALSFGDDYRKAVLKEASDRFLQYRQQVPL